VASELALEAEVVVAAVEPAASLLMSNQLPELLGSASRTSAQWSSGVAVANAAAELPSLGVPAALAKHASHLCACSQTSVEITHISYLTLQSFSIRKDIRKSSQH
jgi:L-asparaginase II